MKIQDIIEKFAEKFIYYFHGDYNWGNPIEPHDKIIDTNPEEYTSFIKESITSLLDSIEKSLPKEISQDEIDKSIYCVALRFQGSNKYRQEVINIINSHK